MIHFLELVVVVGGILALSCLILLSLPQSKLRDLLMPFVSWAFVVLCGIYAASPIDFLPELGLGPLGVADDLVAIVAGVKTAMSTIKAQRQKKAAYYDPYFNN